jgi:hypothetical protein
VHDLAGALPREQQHAGVHLAQGDQLELDRHDGAEAAATAAQRPEQVGVLVAGGADELAVRGHELDGEQAVGREAVAAAEPAEPAAERVADDADVGRGARERREAGFGGGGRDVQPQRAGLDAGDAVRLVDLDRAHLAGLDEHRVVERTHRSSVVAGALHGDPQAVRVGELDERLHVGGAAGERDQRGTLVDREVPGLARRVPGVFTGQDDGPVEAGA